MLNLGAHIWHPFLFCRGEWHHQQLAKGETVWDLVSNLCLLQVLHVKDYVKELKAKEK